MVIFLPESFRKKGLFYLFFAAKTHQTHAVMTTGKKTKASPLLGPPAQA
jgi:hypothetical protein